MWICPTKGIRMKSEASSTSSMKPSNRKDMLFFLMQTQGISLRYGGYNRPSINAQASKSTIR